MENLKHYLHHLKRYIYDVWSLFSISNEKYNIEVINKEVKADDEFDADTIILATGSKQIVPAIQGIEQEFVLQTEDVLENQKN